MLSAMEWTAQQALRPIKDTKRVTVIQMARDARQARMDSVERVLRSDPTRPLTALEISVATGMSVFAVRGLLRRPGKTITASSNGKAKIYGLKK